MLGVSVLSVLGMAPVLGVLACAVLACPCRVGVIRAVLGFGGPCRVEISVLACPCRVLPNPDIYTISASISIPALTEDAY